VIMEKRICKNCKKEFQIRIFSSHTKMGWGIYCSTKCRLEGQKRGEFRKCLRCHKEFWVFKCRSGKEDEINNGSFKERLVM